MPDLDGPLETILWCLLFGSALTLGLGVADAWWRREFPPKGGGEDWDDEW